MISPGIARLWCALIVAPWLMALCAPYRACGFDAPGAQLHGYWLLAIGWIGPLAANFGWYANVLLLMGVARLAMGRLPGNWTALAGLGLAASALLPAWIFDFDTDGRFHANFIRGQAVLWWLASFVILAIGWVIFTILPSFRRPPPKIPS